MSGTGSFFDVKRLEKALRRKIVCRDDWFVPIGVPEGVIFPELDSIAKMVAEKNKFKIDEIVDYSLLGRYAHDELGHEGKIIRLDKGLVILTHDFEFHGENNLEPTLGGKPSESYSGRYILSGRLKARDVLLNATLSYSRGTEQVEKREEITRYKYFKNVPHGEFRKTIYRQDKEKYWFLNDWGK